MLYFLPVLASLFLSTYAVPYGKIENRQSRPDDPVLNQKRADAVKEAFVYAWDGYMDNAFPNDELHPVTNGSSNSR